MTAGQSQPAEEAQAASRLTEASLIGRFVSIITPFFALGAGWLAGVVA